MLTLKYFMDLKEEIVTGKTNKLCSDAGTVQLANWKQTELIIKT